MLLDSRTDIDAETESNLTGLHQAVERGHISTMRILLDRHADINRVNRREETALHLAVVGKNPDIVKL
jgi:ankyrin repeat protein